MTSEKMASGAGYKIGYGKPPKEGQFKKGQSGNPEGARLRANQEKGLARLLDNILGEKLTFLENGRAKRASKQELYIRRLYLDAMNGSTKGARALLVLWRTHQAKDDGPVQIVVTTSKDKKS